MRHVIAAVEAAPARLGPVKLVAVDGPSGGGKSTFARALVRALGPDRTALVPTDDFATWDEPVSWWPRLVDGVLDPFRRGEPAVYRRTEWSDGLPRLGAEVRIDTPEILVLEGVSSGRRPIRSSLSVLVWVCSGDRELRLKRAVARDGEACRDQLLRWQEFEQGWFAVDGTADSADLVIAEHLR
ncbi:Uridine kinase [Allokutzneria albata]|uniref:Uridine kinase n=1 Tax=Allokutzneria albata TaxID=211114 RepID=A0A1H0AFK0_ALLAB|nr:Uridine kinase [Allokutzneria albata]